MITLESLAAMPLDELNRMAAEGPMGWRLREPVHRGECAVWIHRDGASHTAWWAWTPAASVGDAFRLVDACLAASADPWFDIAKGDRPWCVTIGGTTVSDATPARAITMAAILEHQELKSEGRDDG